MGATSWPTQSSRLRFGLARTDITPPVGIYHRMWGAARHFRATGVHRPLYAEVMAFAPLHQSQPALVRVQLDMVGLVQAQIHSLTAAVAAGAGVAEQQVIITFSHTHSGGLFTPDRMGLSGGDLIQPYLQTVADRLRETAGQAVSAQEEAILTYSTGRCAMAGNRDYWDGERSLYACGFNPDTPADDTVQVVRATDTAGRLLAVVVHYACHPTTLAWENTLISPDYVGAMREVVEQATGAPTIFALGACGDLGPRHSHVGDTAVADRNGRQLGYAALGALEAMGPPATEFVYQGPVISGATLGAWTYRPLVPEREAEVVAFAGGNYSVDLPMKPRPDPAALATELADWQVRQREADGRGEATAARDFGARAERARRWLQRLEQLPSGPGFNFTFSVYRMGDAFWITCAGEPYNVIQTELRRRFPQQALLLSPLAGELSVAYLLPADRYGLGIYQEEPSILAPGCLEALTDAVAGRMQALLD